MQISSLIEVIDAKLESTPSISHIYAFKTELKRVKESDLFFAKNIDEANLAIKNGAFAIVYEENLLVSDNEIAWLKVKNLYEAKVKLLRYLLANLNIQAFYCNDISYALLKIYHKQSTKNIYLFSNNINKLLNKIETIKQNDFLISNNKKLLGNIYPHTSSFEKKFSQNSIKNQITHSLFETSFSYKNSYFSKIKLASIYINEFINTFNFLNTNLDLLKLKDFLYLKPIFLDKSLKPIEFGKSDSFLICQEKNELITKEITFIMDNFKYAKYTIFSKHKFQTINNLEINIIQDLQTLKYKLKQDSFNLVYLVGFNYKEVLEFFSSSNQPQTLF